MARTKTYPGHIEERGNGFRVILRVGGERHTYTIRSDDRRPVEQFARDKQKELQELRERRDLGLPGPLPLSALLQRFEDDRLPLLAEGTRKTYLGSLTRFRTYFIERRGDPATDKVRPGHIKEYLSWRRTRGRGDTVVSNRTLQKDRAVLHAVFAFAEELELREGNPVAKVSAPKADPRDPVVLSATQFDALITACEGRPFLHLFVLTMGETGARSESEVLHLQWEDVDLDQGFIRIRSGGERRRTKGGRGRWVPMSTRLKRAMREHSATYRLASYGGYRSRWVFHHPRALRHAKPGDRIRSLRRAFVSAVVRAKLPTELHQHDLRHMRITRWLAEGKNPVHVKEAVGHADLRTTMAYTHLAREHLRSLVETDEDDKDQLKNLGR